jgi:replicative DNA helicase
MEININFNKDVDDKCKNLFDIRTSKIRNNPSDMKKLFALAIKEIEAAKNANGKIRGVPSGFSELDWLTSGWRKSDLIVIAARPGMGKTAFALSLTRNAAKNGIPVAFISLVISAVQLTLRLISSEAEISGEKLKKGDLKEDDWNDLNRKTKNLEDAPIFIDDTSLLSIFELRGKCMQQAEEHQIGLIVIDNIQIMRDNNHSGVHQQDISNISRSLKALAEELDIPIIVISQLSRSVETRGGIRKPQLSDLNEFGSIHQEADMVLFVYRPEYYGIIEDDIGESTRGKAEIIIAKNKNGSLDSVFLKFIGKYMKFEEYPFEKF